MALSDILFVMGSLAVQTSRLDEIGLEPKVTAGPVDDVVTREADFEDFCRQNYRDLANALVWTLGNRELGQEAADEAMVCAYEKWNSVRGIDNPAGWAYRVGLNWGRQRIRRANRARRLLSTVPIDPVHLDYYADTDLPAALYQLPQGQRAVIVMRHFMGYSEAEVAVALGIRVGTVKSRNRRALDKLRTLMKDHSK